MLVLFDRLWYILSINCDNFINKLITNNFWGCTYV